MNNNFPTPREIVEHLDKHIIGQADAKKSVAIALRNRWRRQQADAELRAEIMPNNIIMIGPTGVGKTEIARRLSEMAHAPFIKVEASKFTEVGYVGRDVESMVRDLVDISVNMVKIEKSSEWRLNEFLNCFSDRRHVRRRAKALRLRMTIHACVRWLSFVGSCWTANWMTARLNWMHPPNSFRWLKSFRRWAWKSWGSTSRRCSPV